MAVSHGSFVAVESMGDILKLACRCFLGSAFSSGLRFGIGGTSGSVGSACGRLEVSRGLVRSPHDVGRLGGVGRYATGSASAL